LEGVILGVTLLEGVLDCWGVIVILGVNDEVTLLEGVILFDGVFDCCGVTELVGLRELEGVKEGVEVNDV
jgi:hypothetical protein